MATSEKVKLPGARLSFARLFVPKSFREGQPERYEGTFLLDPSNKKHAKVIDDIIAQAEDVIVKTYGKKVPAKLSFCFGYADGDDMKIAGKTVRSEIKEYDGYEGMFYISSSNRQRPPVVDRDRTPLVEADGRPYSGCYVNGSITLWGQDNEYGKRINANLRAVQFVADGEAFGVKPVDADEEFDEIEDDLDDDDEKFLD